MRRRVARFGALLVVAATVACSSAGPPPAAEPPAGYARPLARVRLEVLKRERTLLLYSGDLLVARYPIALGSRPVGSKIQEGDGATPEGRYAICVKNPRSRYYLSVGLNYPNAQDADRALEAGLIDEAEHRRIVRALARGECPPWDTALGGEIFIHGRGAWADWTLGCIALDDPAMKRLYGAVRIGSPVVIKP